MSSYGRVLFYLTCDMQDNLWACLDGCNGVLKITPNFDVELLSQEQGLTSRGIVLRSDNEGNLFCGGIGDSTYLFKYNYSNHTFTNISVPLSFPHSDQMVVNDISVDDKIIYLATSEGVISIDNNQAQLLDLGEYTRKNVGCIATDKLNFLWFSNENGLFQYKEGKYYIFSEKDGLNANTGSYRCLAIDNNNHIWFGTHTGLNYSEGINEIYKTEKPIISRILIDGKPVDCCAKKLKMKRHSYIQFEFIALEMPGTDLSYQTRLIGKKIEHDAKTHQNTAIYPNLPLGNYTLEIKARQHGNYDWSDVTSFSFSVEPNWYQTWWAWISYILLFLLLFFIFNHIYNYRLLLQKRRLEHGIKIRTEEIVSKNEQLQYLNTTKDKFFHIIAHDLRNPFSGIYELSNYIVDAYDELDEQTKFKLIQSIYSTTQNTFSLLENLLEWARTQTNAIDYNPELLNLRKLIQNTVEVSAAVCHSKNIQITYEADESIQFMGDRNMLTTVLRNLILNAVKYSFRDESIHIDGIISDRFVKVSVIDHGTGINPKRMEELFKITQKSSVRGTENEKGTGLGLILCKEFIEKHNGTISVESVVSRGSTFWFQIPL